MKYKGTTKHYLPISEYRDTGRVDDNGLKILEGSVIIGNGYGENSFYCAAYDEDDCMFTSCCYGDADALSMYDSIIVKGHCTDFIKEFESGNYNGNLGAVIKYKTDKDILIEDEINVRQKIPFDLPELLDRYEEMKKVLENIFPEPGATNLRPIEDVEKAFNDAKELLNKYNNE